MKRRTFVKNTAAVTAASILAPNVLTSKSLFEFKPVDKIMGLDDDNIVIIVELFGGNDGLNSVIPAYDDTYYNLRPNLGIPSNIAKRFETTDIYFHPLLVQGIHNDGFMRLMADGRLAIIQGIGYENPNLSHFRSEDIILSGINSSDPKVKLLEGWLGRYIAMKLTNFPFEIPEHPIAIEIGGTLSMLLKSNKGDMGIAFTDPQKFYELGTGLTPEEELSTGNTVFDSEFNFVNIIARQSEKYSSEVLKAYNDGKSKLKVKYSNGLAKSFEMISSLIAGGLKTKFFFVKLSNFDSHAQQQNADYYTGQHPTLLWNVASGISEFLDDAVQQGWADRVVGMTISEFGRRPSENGSRGTDHGAASVQFVFGNYAKGGYFGNKPNLNDLDEAGNQKMQYDYRRVYTDFLQTWLGASSEEVKNVFGIEFLPLGVLKKRQLSVENPIVVNDNVFVYPNPSFGEITVNFELKSLSDVDISVFNLLGRIEKKISKGWLDAGYHKIKFRMEKSGSYFISISTPEQRITKEFTVLR